MAASGCVPTYTIRIRLSGNYSASLGDCPQKASWSKQGTLGASLGCGPGDASAADVPVPPRTRSPQEPPAALSPGATSTTLRSFTLMQTDTGTERWRIYYPHLSATNPAQFHAFRTNSRQRATGRGSISQCPMPSSVSSAAE